MPFKPSLWKIASELKSAYSTGNQLPENADHMKIAQF